MKKILILGGGMVGSVMAADLSKSYNVTAADLNTTLLKKLQNEYEFAVIELNVMDKIKSGQFYELVKDYDLILGAMPGYLGFEVMKEVLNCGKPIVDISFFPENPFELDELAKSKNTFGIMDIGVAPGMGNLFLSLHSKSMTVENFECYVGGLPLERKMPFQYKAPFSPIDVIEEYTRPARLKVNGEIVVKPAMSELEDIDFDEIGTLQAFNSDGLRSLLYTFPDIPNMKEKTLRYPGHIDLITTLQKIGFLDNNEIEVNGKMIKPLELTSKLLIDQWKLGENDDEFTVMYIEIEGIEKSTNRKKRVSYHLHHLRDFITGFSSMSTTTGYTATSVIDYILSNDFEKSDKYCGIYPPELIGDKELVDYVLRYQLERGISYEINEEYID